MGAIDTAFERLAERFGLELAQVRAEFSAGLKETNNALRLQGARNLPMRQASGLLWGGPGRLVGWGVRVRGGTVIVTLYDGRDNGADQLAAFTLANNGEAVGSSAEWFGPGGVSVTEALYVDVTVVTGTPVFGGGVYLGSVD